MIEKLDYVNFRNQTWSFNTDTCPLKDFHVDGDIRSANRPHMMDHGEWESFSYVDAVVVHIEGDLLYSTTETYIAGRLSLMSILVPPPGRQKIRPWGTLYLRYTGQTEDFTNRVRLEGYPEIPMQALSPSVTPFMLAFRCFSPYWTGSGTGRKLLV